MQLFSFIKKLNIFGNANVSPESLEQLSYSVYVNERYRVAKNPNTPSEVLEKLANDEYYWVRRGVLQKTPKHH